MRAKTGSAASMLCGALLIAAILFLGLPLLGFAFGGSDLFPMVLLLLCLGMHLFMHHGHQRHRAEGTRPPPGERSNDEAVIGSS